MLCGELNQDGRNKSLRYFKCQEEPGSALLLWGTSSTPHYFSFICSSALSSLLPPQPSPPAPPFFLLLHKGGTSDLKTSSSGLNFLSRGTIKVQLLLLNYSEVWDDKYLKCQEAFSSSVDSWITSAKWNWFPAFPLSSPPLLTLLPVSFSSLLLASLYDDLRLTWRSPPSSSSSSFTSSLSYFSSCLGLEVQIISVL